MYSVENECHVICDFPLYEDLRNTLFEYAKPVIQNFETLNSQDKMCGVLSNTAIVKYTAKILHEILVRRRSFICNKMGSVGLGKQHFEILC